MVVQLIFYSAFPDIPDETGRVTRRRKTQAIAFQAKTIKNFFVKRNFQHAYKNGLTSTQTMCRNEKKHTFKKLNVFTTKNEKTINITTTVTKVNIK